MTIRRAVALLALCVLILTGCSATGDTKSGPVEIRAVVVTAFQNGSDTDRSGGEFASWAADIPDRLPFQAGERDLRYDKRSGVLVVMTGMGTARAAATITALGLDARFDLRRAYWIVAAIAGVNPNAASIGSAAWINQVVDTDFGKSIDGREVPQSWNGVERFPYGADRPFAEPKPDSSNNLFTLDRSLTAWAYNRTKNVRLPDTDRLRSARAPFVGFPSALRPPGVVLGSEATGQDFWHGAIANSFVERWVSYWTGTGDRFVMTGMEDSGILRALASLGRMGRVDNTRALVLRAGSNFTTPAPGVSAAAEIDDGAGHYDGAEAAFLAAHSVAAPVINELVGSWSRYRDAKPAA